jgi:hypothetical protein
MVTYPPPTSEMKTEKMCSFYRKYKYIYFFGKDYFRTNQNGGVLAICDLEIFDMNYLLLA